jgi:hypothetical protein
MKKIILLASLVFSLNAIAQIPTNGLVAYYSFSGNANDNSGNGFNGTISNATLTSDRFGNPNSAYNFNGTTSKIDILNFTVNPQNFSICLWYNATVNGMAGTNEFLHRCQPTNRMNYCWNLSWGLQNNQNYLHTLLKTTSGSVVNQSGSNLAINIWQMATMTFDGNYKRVYINGVLIDSTNLAGQTIDYTNKTGIFLGYDSQMDYYNGKLDDIRIYDRAISSSEVSILYNEGVCYTNITVTDTLLINTNITGFNPVTYQNTIKVWPNPTHDHITIDNGNIASLTGYQVKITNSLSQQVFQSAITQQQFYVDLSTWTGNGIYFVHIIDGQGNTIDIKKIILQ